MQIKNENVSETRTVSGPQEGRMASTTAQQGHSATLVNTCTHSRLIDNVLTRDGRWTGKVLCRECGAKFDDPYRGLK